MTRQCRLRESTMAALRISIGRLKELADVGQHAGRLECEIDGLYRGRIRVGNECVAVVHMLAQ